MRVIVPGLVSVTFRQLAPAAVVDLAVRAGLCGIEWGADVHVPDVPAARRVASLTGDAGLVVACYGSYPRPGGGGGGPPAAGGGATPRRAPPRRGRGRGPPRTPAGGG